MKRLILHLYFCLVCLLFYGLLGPQQLQAQDLYNLSVKVTQVSHNFECCDDDGACCGNISCGSLSNAPEPRFSINAGYNLGGGTPNSFSGFINLGQDVSCGTYPLNYTIFSANGICLDEVLLAVDMWEEDGCGSDEVFNGSCTDADDNRSQPSTSIATSSFTGNTFSQTLSGSNGYSVVFEITWSLVAAPTVSGASTICQGTSTTLTAVSSEAVPGATFRWYDAASGGTLLFTGNNFSTPALSNTATYFVSYGTANCATARTSFTVNVSSQAAPAVSGTSGSICAGENRSLTASAMGAADYYWYADPNGFNFLTSGSSFTTPPLNSSTTFYVAALSAAGCESSLSAAAITVGSTPAAPVAPDQTFCESDVPILTANAAGNTLRWFNSSSSNTILGTGNTYSPGSLSAGTYIYYVEAFNGTCASIRTGITLTVNASPTAPTPANATVCSGESATLSISAAGQYNWYADAALTNLAFVGNTFQTPGLTSNTTYWVTRETNNCESVANSTTVTVEPLPSAPSVSASIVCTGQSTTISASGSGGTLEWYASANSTAILGVGTTYTTSLLSQNTSYYVAERSTNNCLGPRTLVNVTVEPTPNPPTAPNITVCDGDDLILEGVGSGSGDIVFYDAGNTEIGRGSMSSGSNSITLNIGTQTAAGSFTYFVAEERSTGCISPLNTILVDVLAPVPTPTAMNDGPVCAGEDLVLQASGSGNAGYTWSGPNGFINSGQTLVVPNITLAQSGSYSVTATINGCPSASASTNVVINALPTLSSSISTNSPLCEGDDLVLTAPIDNNLVYEWTGPGGYINNQAVDTIPSVREETQQGFYVLVVTDQTTGCVSNPEATLVQVNRLPTPGMAGSNSPICAGDTLELEVAPVFGASYSWTGPGGFSATGNNPSLAATTTASSGTYDVEVEVSGCITTLQSEVRVNPIPETTRSGDLIVNEGETATLAVTGGVAFDWSPAEYLNSASLAAVTFFGAPAGTYTYDAEIFDISGCSAVETFTVEVLPQTQLQITNLFTPNGDGFNDTWEIEFLDNVGTYTLRVFSRGGLEIYRSENYSNDWDGTHYKTGGDLPEDAYFYIIESEEGTFKGAVTITR